jgi:exodeoxyribonuclease III
MRLLSWNVNGLRAAEKKGFLDLVRKWDVDILGIQETKLQEPQISKELHALADEGYFSYWDFAKRPGYSGVAAFSKHQPEAFSAGLGIEKFDVEGRVVRLDFSTFTYFTIYFPNGGRGPERVEYKLDFYAEFLKQAKHIEKQGKGVIFCGDINTAHTEIDLARPKENQKVSGFLPEERAWVQKFIDAGFIDTFREFDKEGSNYTWWDMKSGARARNVGWRIDYFFISKNLLPKLQSAFIWPDILGSDHAPVGIDIDLKI